MVSRMAVTLGAVTDLLEEWYPPACAEVWDAVGLVCGDPRQLVGRALFAVDPAPEVVDEAVAWGADLLVVHHPLLLKPVHSVAATSPKGRTLHRLVRANVALFTAHTNADSPPQGVNESLAAAIGLLEPQVIAREAGDTLCKIVVFVPDDHADAVREAMTSAGAGAIGDYDSCTFTTRGEGRFRPLDGADPAIGEVGTLEVVPESRIEAVVPHARRDEVIAAMRAAHPYEEVAFDVLSMADVPSGMSDERGSGRVGSLAVPLPLRDFAAHVERVLPRTAAGIRVGGDPERRVSTVAVTSGAGDFLLEKVLTTDADVYVTSDLRHHRANEFLEHDGPALVDVPHWAAEWTWLPNVAQRLTAALTAKGDTVETRVSTTCTDPWTFRP